MSGQRPWRMQGENGLDADTLEAGDWLVTYPLSVDKPVRWCEVIDAKPTPTDLDPCALDVIVIWEGESKHTHYRIPSPQYTFRWAGKHRPVCGHCGGAWPCEQVRMVRQVNRDLFEQTRQCVACGKSDGGNTMSIKRETPGGVVSAVYHTAKSRKQCRAALIEAASARDLAWLRQMERS